MTKAQLTRALKNVPADKNILVVASNNLQRFAKGEICNILDVRIEDDLVMIVVDCEPYATLEEAT